MKRLLPIIMAVGLELTACTTTKVVTIERVEHDTTYITRHHQDSIWLHDSIRITQKAESVFVERWHTKYVGKLRIDTLIKIRVDSIPTPYEVVKEVPRQLTWWQRIQMYAGDALFLAVIAGIAVFIIRKQLTVR